MGICLYEGCILKSVIGLQVAFLRRLPKGDDFIPISILPRQVSFLVIITPVLGLFFLEDIFQGKDRAESNHQRSVEWRRES